MRVTIELRPPARRSIALVVGAALLLVPGVALASHHFMDVPESNVFHDAISNIAVAGITAGFGDGGYHPSEPVSRQAMAAFLDRGLGHAALITNIAPAVATVTANTGDASGMSVPILSLTIEVPGATNAFGPEQFVYVHGRVVLEASMSASVNGCPCEFTALVFDPDTNEIYVNAETFESASRSTFTYTLDVDGLFVAEPGPKTYILGVFLSNRDATTSAASFATDSKSLLSATTFPFRSGF
jgi:hypothetical protein